MKPNPAEKFHDFVQHFDMAVLITHGAETHFHARPMAIAQVDENCDLWFISADESAKVHEIEMDTRVQVIGLKGNSCLSLAGRATLVRDRFKIRELWRPSFRVWFPQGMEDPNIVLIHVRGEQAEYWDNTGAKGLTYIYRAIKAVVTGTKPEIKEGEQHGQLRLSSVPQERSGRAT
jgi:general stress protein 26